MSIELGATNLGYLKATEPELLEHPFLCLPQGSSGPAPPLTPLPSQAGLDIAQDAEPTLDMLTRFGTQYGRGLEARALSEVASSSSIPHDWRRVMRKGPFIIVYDHDDELPPAPIAAIRAIHEEQGTVYTIRPNLDRPWPAEE